MKKQSVPKCNCIKNTVPRFKTSAHGVRYWPLHEEGCERMAAIRLKWTGKA